MGSIIECIKRIYRIQTPNGIKMDVESEERSISGTITAKLLQEDTEISSFFEKCKILDVNVFQEGKARKDKERVIEKGSLTDLIRKSKKKLKKHKETKKTSEAPKIKIEELKGEYVLAPFERLNVLLKMEGEFTRIDYQKFMVDTTQKMSDFMGHEDIEVALLLKKIEVIEEKTGRLRKYRVIDTNPVDRDTYRQMIKEHKMEIKY